MFVCKPETVNQEAVITYLRSLASWADQKDLHVPEKVHVDFDLTSSVDAGRAGAKSMNMRCDHDYVLHFHGKALEFYGQDYMDTVVHEFCHILQFINHPNRKNGHDATFYYYMEMFGVDDPKRCHHYDLYKVNGKKRVRQRRWEYACECDKCHSVATVTHNRMQKKGQVRVCKTCKEELSWTGKEIK